MRRSSDPSRRALLRMAGLGSLATLLCVPRGQAQIVPIAPIILTVGGVSVTKVTVVPVNQGTPIVAKDGQFCKLESGGITFRAEVVLEPRGGAKPAWFGQLILLQNVNFLHKRVAAKNGQRTCAGSRGTWQLDGQDPYLNHVVPAHHGSNAIDLADDPGVFTEDPTTPYEQVEVPPVDQFRTYVAWEITDNNLPPSKTNPKKRHFLARVDWTWQGVALNPPPAAALCQSTTYAPNAWGVQAQAANFHVYTGRAALRDPVVPSRTITPVTQPAAQPNSWRPC